MIKLDMHKSQRITDITEYLLYADHRVKACEVQGKHATVLACLVGETIQKYSVQDKLFRSIQNFWFSICHTEY